MSIAWVFGILVFAVIFPNLDTVLNLSALSVVLLLPSYLLWLLAAQLSNKKSIQHQLAANLGVSLGLFTVAVALMFLLESSQAFHQLTPDQQARVPSFVAILTCVTLATSCFAGIFTLLVVTKPAKD